MRHGVGDIPSNATCIKPRIDPCFDLSEVRLDDTKILTVTTRIACVVLPCNSPAASFTRKVRKMRLSRSRAFSTLRIWCRVVGDLAARHDPCTTNRHALRCSRTGIVAPA